MNNTNNELAEEIVRKANMSTRPAYYSGRGALLEDFNFGKPSLNVIYNELRNINEKYAQDFIDFVMSFKNLNATDFLTSFYKFAKNNFSLESIQITECGYNLDANNDEQRDAIAFVTIFSAFGNSGRDDTEAIKSKFLYLLPDDVRKLTVKKYESKKVETIQWNNNGILYTLTRYHD